MKTLRVDRLLRGLSAEDQALVRDAMRYSRILRRSPALPHLLICRKCPQHRRVFAFLGHKECPRCGKKDVLVTRELRWGPKLKGKVGRAGGVARFRDLSPVQKAEFAASGGLARAFTLDPERRSEIARKAAEARWGKKKKPGGSDRA